MSYLLPPAGGGFGGFTVGGAVAGAIMNEILINDMMVYYKKSELCMGYHHYIVPSQQSAELAQLLPVEE